MNKLVVNHLDKIFVTSDASVMMTELEVQHPAAKLLVMAAKSQETEIGDGTNMVRLAPAYLIQRAQLKVSVRFAMLARQG
jgi:T-complex protein 1 subunit theta